MQVAPAQSSHRLQRLSASSSTHCCKSPPIPAHLVKEPGGPEGRVAEAHGGHGAPDPAFLLVHDVVQQQDKLRAARGREWGWVAAAVVQRGGKPAPLRVSPTCMASSSPTRCPCLQAWVHPQHLEHDAGKQEGWRNGADHGGRLRWKWGRHGREAVHLTGESLGTGAMRAPCPAARHRCCKPLGESLPWPLGGGTASGQESTPGLACSRPAAPTPSPWPPAGEAMGRKAGEDCRGDFPWNGIPLVPHCWGGTRETASVSP